MKKNKLIFLNFRKAIGFTLLGICIFVGSLIGFLSIQSHQIVVLSPPTGTYHVGRKSFEWTDSSRTNAFAGKPAEQRKLMEMAWYPTDDISGNQASYIPQPWLNVSEKEQSGFGEILTHKLTNVLTNSLSDAPISNSKKVNPVIILEPGLGRASFDYSYIAEDLASHGYIVISSTTTYIADLVVFSDGKTASASNEIQLNETGAALKGENLRKIELVRDVYADDISYLLTQIVMINKSLGNVWAGRINTSQIGIMGHSIGGAAAYHVCLTDIRCKVAVDMDGTLFGEQGSVNKVPFMFLGSDTTNDVSANAIREDAFNQAIFNKQHSLFFQVTINGTEHFNFSDLSVRSPLIRYFGALGTLDSQKGIDMVRKYVVMMFDTSIGFTKPGLLNSNNAIPGSIIVQ